MKTPYFAMIVDALNDLANAQENGSLPSANQYPVNVIREQAEALESWQAARAQQAESGEAVIAKDAYNGAREDLQIWKRRALEAEKLLQEEIESNARLIEICNDLTGPAHMGEPVLPAHPQPAQQGIVPDVGAMADVLGEWVRNITGTSLTHVTLVDMVRVMLTTTPQPADNCRHDRTHKTGLGFTVCNSCGAKNPPAEGAE